MDKSNNFTPEISKIMEESLGNTIWKSQIILILTSASVLNIIPEDLPTHQITAVGITSASNTAIIKQRKLWNAQALIIRQQENIDSLEEGILNSTLPLFGGICIIVVEDLVQLPSLLTLINNNQVFRWHSASMYDAIVQKRTQMVSRLQEYNLSEMFTCQANTAISRYSKWDYIQIMNLNRSSFMIDPNVIKEYVCLKQIALQLLPIS
ncbi:hypothetical protein RhiirA4_457208 [Rhizophagus irregularis]|uniref:Uncharacterized protein n=1 Tax=Rhizophagus irregularis TaxID=588596 RepID=A0A2I1G9E1_9GLOM|nr:hypothetical protein RhiirA4_457208 [Rhizophagus irregularis]